MKPIWMPIAMFDRSATYVPADDPEVQLADDENSRDASVMRSGPNARV